MTQAPAHPEKTWRDRRTVRLLITSATQHETFELCPRKWWLDNVRKLPVPQTTPGTFGTVLHAVCERFLSADDLGRDPKTGQPVDLYPQGWEVAWDKYKPGAVEGVVTPAEQDLIKRLVAKAIEEGVLERRPGRSIEHSFRRTVVQLTCPDCRGMGSWDGNLTVEKCPTCGGDGKGTHIQIMGFIDMLFRDSVEDHKSTKSMKWAKSQNALAKSTQMLIYAHEALEACRERGEPLPKAITLRHNVYCKDPDAPRVRKTEVTVTAQDIEKKWQEIIENSRQMDLLRRTANVWHDIPDPTTPGACNAYGGCAFRTICCGQESEEGYQNRLDRFTQSVSPSPLTVNGTVPHQKGSDMSGFPARLAQVQGNGAAIAGAVPGAINPPPPQQYQPQPVQQYATSGQQPAPVFPQQATAPAPMQAPPQQQSNQQPAPPPWAKYGCGACNGLGFNTNGIPCRICDGHALETRNVTSSLYVITPIGNGLCQWTARDGSGHTGISWLPQGAMPVQADTRVQVQPQQQIQPPPQQFASPPAPPPQPVQPPAGPLPQTPHPSYPPPQPQQQAQEPAQTEEKSTKGRPAKTFMLIVNAPQVKGYESRGDRAAKNLNDVLKAVGEDLAKAKGAASFYELPAFERRDSILSVGQKIAEGFGTGLVVADGIGFGASDLRTLYDAVLPYASHVFGGPR